MSTKRLALVTSSIREPRLNPAITSHVHEMSKAICLAQQTSLETIDLRSISLPPDTEPEVPSHLPMEGTSSHYAFTHTREWSNLVSQYDCFIFVTPQYNWSVPAGLKNALDYLFHEWKGKSAGIVTYGVRGGGKAANHLRDILNGLRMKVAPTMPALPIPTNSVEVGQDEKDKWDRAGLNLNIETMVKEVLEASQEIRQP
ncbi:hypothetical protein RBB50_003188 [Rhinocladiella similis]